MKKFIIFFIYFVFAISAISVVAQNRRFEGLQAVAGSRTVASEAPVADTYTPQASNHIAFWYRFTDFTNSIGNFTDYSGQGRMGNNDGNLTFVSSPPSVQSLDGTRYGTCATNDPFFGNGCTAIIFSCWVRIDSNVNQYAGVFVGTGNIGPLGFTKENTVYTFFNFKHDVWPAFLNSTSNITTDVGTWHWLVGQWNAAHPAFGDRGMEVFFDGKRQALVNEGGKPTMIWTSGSLRLLWRDNYGNERKLWGTIDECMVRTNTTLTTNQVWQEWMDMPRSLYGR